MSKELIRNGGFERNNTDFWESLSGVLEVQTDEKKFGTYAGKVTCEAAGAGVTVVKDYIEVSEGELFKSSVQLKNTAAAATLYHMYQTFDSDLGYMGDYIINSKAGAFAWFEFIQWFTIIKGISYIRPFVRPLLGAPDDIFYIDSMSLQRIDTEKLGVRDVSLLKLTNICADATAYSQEFFTGIWKHAEYHLYCTSLTGTTPTLNVTIQGYDPSTEQWKDVLVFQELDDAGSEFKTLLSGLGWKQRAKYVTAGTVTDCDFTLGVVYKR